MIRLSHLVQVSCQSPWGKHGKAKVCTGIFLIGFIVTSPGRYGKRPVSNPRNLDLIKICGGLDGSIRFSQYIGTVVRG